MIFIQQKTDKTNNRLNYMLLRCSTLLFFICLYSYTANAQKDTTAILELINKGRQVVDSNADLGLQYFTEALNKSKKDDYKRGIALASAKIGNWYFGNNIDKTIEYANQAAQIYETNNAGSLDDKADAHLLLAEAYDENGKKDSSAYFYYLLDREIETGNLKNPQLAIDIYTKLTIFWINMDFGTTANEEYLKTITRYVEKAKDVANTIKNSEEAVSSIYFLEGVYYHATKKFDSSRYYYFEYIKERERLKKFGVFRKISTLSNIADTYLQENNPVDAMRYINEVKALGNDPQNSKYLVFFMAFTDLLKGKAMFQQRKYKEAIQILDDALERLRTTGGHLRNEVVEAYKISADSYEALGDYKKALQQNNTYIRLYDSLMKKDKVDMVSRLEIRYRLAEKDKALAEQNLRIAGAESKVSNRNFFIGGISFLAIFAAVVFVLWRRKNIHRQKLQDERIESLQKTMEIERLNASIAGEEKERTRIARELHDGIGGLLSAAKMNFELVRKNNNDYDNNPDFAEGIKLLEETSAGLRETAHNIMPEVLLQEGLTGAVRSFCERIMGKTNTSINFQVLGKQQKPDSTFDLSVYRIIQELIHNVVKHANASSMLVQMNFHEDGGLDITVEDDGIGINEETIKNAMGMGLKNIAERAKHLRGKLDIYSAPGKGTSMYLEFEPDKNIIS